MAVTFMHDGHGPAWFIQLSNLTFVNTIFGYTEFYVLIQKRGEYSQIGDINEWWRGEGTCINGPWRSRKQVLNLPSPEIHKYLNCPLPDKQFFSQFMR
jgi:hypothetical protein